LITRRQAVFAVVLFFVIIAAVIVVLATGKDKEVDKKTLKIEPAEKDANV
jgi:hypothetical protein